MISILLYYNNILLFYININLDIFIFNNQLN